MRLLIHESVPAEFSESDVDGFLAKVTAAVNRRLELTSGSALKTLRGPYGGTALRCRYGNHRIPLSVVEEDGQRWVVVHQVAHRKGVYESHEFRSRLDAFHGQIFDHEGGSWRADPRECGYIEVEVSAATVEASGPSPTLEPWLSSEQSQVLTGLLPFPTTWGAQDAVMMIAKGAPGSGKTLVAAELADVAATQCDYSVRLLVPTLKLKEHYGQWLDTSAGSGDLSVELVQEYFQDCVGNVISEPMRLNTLRLWWQEALELAALQAWLKRHPIVRSARFLALVDAALIGDLDEVLSAKDALDAADDNLYKRLKELSTNGAWRVALDVLQKRHGLTLRCQAARNARFDSDHSESRPLLVVVDECQDLVPEEWQALMRMVAVRRATDRGTRIALLGDEAQRLAPTSFAWADLLRFADRVLRWPRRAAQEVVLPGSYRVPRVIGEMGIRVFRPPLADLGKSRHVDLLDAEKLPGGGEVFLLSYAEGGSALQAMERAVAASGGSRALVMIDAETGTDTVPPLSQVERLPIALAKGLEFSSVIINPPFSSDLPMPFDRAAALYTALTRATSSALCLVPHRLWDTMVAAMTGLAYSALHLETAASRQEAVDVLLGFAQQTSTEELAAVLAARIRGSMDEYRLTARSGDRETLVRQMIRDAGALVHLERLPLLGTELAHEARDLSDLPREISMLEDLSTEEQVSGLLLTGQYGAVVDLLNWGRFETEAGWVGGAVMVAEAEQSELERTIMTSGGAGGRPIRERLASALAVALARDLPPGSTPHQMAPSPRAIYEASLITELQILQVHLEGELASKVPELATEDDGHIGRAMERVDALAERLSRLAGALGLAA